MHNRRSFIQGVLIGAGLSTIPDIASSLSAQQNTSKPKVPYLKTPTLNNGTCPDLMNEGARLTNPPTEADLIKKLYSKIEDSFSLGANAPYPGHAFLVLCNPGIFIDPNLNLTKKADRIRLSAVLNSVPESSFAFVFQDSGIQVQSVYDQIMSNHLTANYQLTAAQKQQLKDAEAVLKNSGKMDDYFKYQALYAAAADKLANARANEQNGGAPVDPQLIVAFNKSKHDFQIKGHMYQVNCAQEIYDQLLGGDASGGVTPTGLMPFYTTGVLLARNVELTANFSVADKSWMNKIVDGSTSVGWGPFSFSGHYHHEEHSQSSSGSVVGTTIKTKPGDVQVLGLFCDVLPHCPDKNPALQWPKGAKS